MYLNMKRKFEDRDTKSFQRELEELDAQLTEAVNDVINCTSTELQKRSEALMLAKDNRIAAADRFRVLQMKNITQLYQYDVEDAEAVFKVSTDILNTALHYYCVLVFITLSFVCRIFNSEALRNYKKIFFKTVALPLRRDDCR